jgi:site-specific DNA-methyltransferase (adenine-specific)
MRNKMRGKMNEFGKKPTKEYFDELFRVSKNQIIWGANNFLENLYSTNCFLFWYKRNPMENYSDGELAWTSFHKVARCIPIDHYGSNTRDKIKTHPTQKPVALYKWILDKYAKQGDKILDTHLGSGSIAIACHDMGFDLTACELDPDYYNAAMKRLTDHQKQLKLL